MRRIALWLASTAVVLVLLAGYHTSFAGPLAIKHTSVFSAGALAPSQTPTRAGGTAGHSTSGARRTTSPGTTSPGTTSSATASPRTVTGQTAQTQWGPVQVELTLDGSAITGVAVLQFPNGNSTDAQINNYALPILVKETMGAQSAKIDMVSGATYTSTGYLQSLQSALDQAGT